MSDILVAFIGGSGLYNIDGISNIEKININTPFGNTSAPITIGKLNNSNVAFLPRHGINHEINPSEIPSKANIYALKSIGVKKIISLSAVGSLQKEIEPLDIVIPNQIIDRTKSRPSTFFENGIVAHISFAEPFCNNLNKLLVKTGKNLNINLHQDKTYLAMEGPQFSTKAESELYRNWGAHIIGMTAIPESKLAREAEICYSTIAMVTDYDCWHETEEDVSVELVIQNLMKNIYSGKKIIFEITKLTSLDYDCECSNALKNAIITNKDSIPKEIKESISLFTNKYL
ncbi:MAG: S-methyl-5'-thioadenosine phosphorylase [Chloroflexi bacterium]|nr:S-methyl-5'-thioadenosine phosphorylase [Chloroflexota bacterium]|tara:strand:- start:335 stop:1195 length:861 start_codon:yes stop_codon:yes gene_type:complete